MKILNCSDRGARRLLIKLKEMNVVVVVSGKGKGMYRLKYDGEK
jgi:ATP-dependent DNA helicase RecG